ncbi:Hypothetical predicted protein [Pelobates cultripes]|uniref:Uncharacterized protein n=1 Tax=Pelobates cultripes TaxID=61616 RepID=A0AAD1SHK8_PELCU|nr:Hypothetical predicted protein [Pelobates cultripes]
MAAAALEQETDERHKSLEQRLDDLIQRFWRKITHKADHHKQGPPLLPGAPHQRPHEAPGGQISQASRGDPPPPKGANNLPQPSTAQMAHTCPEKGKTEAPTGCKTPRPPTTPPNPATKHWDSNTDHPHKQAITHNCFPQAAAPGRMEATPSDTTGGNAQTDLTQGHWLNEPTWTIHTAPGTPYVDISTPK